MEDAHRVADVSMALARLGERFASFPFQPSPADKGTRPLADAASRANVLLSRLSEGWYKAPFDVRCELRTILAQKESLEATFGAIRGWNALLLLVTAPGSYLTTWLFFWRTRRGFEALKRRIGDDDAAAENAWRRATTINPRLVEAIKVAVSDYDNAKTIPGNFERMRPRTDLGS